MVDERHGQMWMCWITPKESTLTWVMQPGILINCGIIVKFINYIQSSFCEVYFSKVFFLLRIEVSVGMGMTFS